MTALQRPSSLRTGAIIVAAGSSRRMHGVDKLLAPLGGRPVVAHSIAVFASHPAVDEVVVVTSAANQEAIGALAAELAPRARVILGGVRRRDSVRAGLEALTDCVYVIVHDAARPLVTPAMIDAALEGAREAGAALCAVPVADTVKRSEPSGRVSSTVTREGLWLAQTPQAFRRELLLRAHQTIDIDATDDAALIELLGEPVKLVMGSPRNLKITQPEDLALARAILASLSQEQEG
ncbi:MAG TPA: 2-C-methyl-D-erythritol 4-phosphate cytidylyltransferase [Dehalococcoidia bacterium]|nr:2-C-methyl-D-erythritol 4-phosphate cytidylyltransferase [Dehalococcoidia bacterium]